MAARPGLLDFTEHASLAFEEVELTLKKIIGEGRKFTELFEGAVRSRESVGEAPHIKPQCTLLSW